jgi:hypothetical protein
MGLKAVSNTGSGGGGTGATNRVISSISTNTNAAAIANTDYIYLITGTVTLTLPTAVGNTNVYTVKNVGTGVVTIATTSSQTIDGFTTLLEGSQYQSYDVVSDNANWNVI